MSANKSLALIGLPSSGKSTFLAALWYLVDGNRQTVLTIDELDGDREYLNKIRENWLSCDSLDRTRLVNEHVASMRLINTATNKIVSLNIPDLSGETFLAQWLERSWTQDFQNVITNADGALLFVHPDKIAEPIRIDQADSIRNEILEREEQNSEDQLSEFQEWDPKIAPTQVQLVEILQFIQANNSVNFPFRLAVIISAWDLIKHLERAPEKWLSGRLSLLAQYLSTRVLC